MRFLDGLVNFDKDNIPVKVMQRLQKFLNDDNFDPEKVKTASTACEGLCKWAIAISKYDKVAKIVAPKKQALAKAESELNEAMTALRIKRNLLEETRKKVTQLEALLDEENFKFQKLNDEAELCTKKLQRAQELISGLGGEKDRWTNTARNLGITYVNITGDVLIGSGIIAYLGSFTLEFRTKQTQQWTEKLSDFGLKCTKHFQLSAIFGEPVLLQQWIIFGLPADSFSLDNAIILKYAVFYPICVFKKYLINQLFVEFHVKPYT